MVSGGFWDVGEERDLEQFRFRVAFALVVVLLAFAVLFGRFFFLQVLKHD